MTDRTDIQSFSDRIHYSRGERISDGVVHVIGLVAAVAAVPVLITLAVIWHADASAVTSVAVYGASLIAMILCSALYNMVPDGAWSGLLRRLDHSAIYFKIAGTYTPLVMLSGGQGGGLLAGLWGAALAGTGIRVFGSARLRWIALGLYLAMGWAGVVAGWELFGQLSAPVFWLVVSGGLTYTLGVGFLLAANLRYHNTIWHVFVLTATVLFFVAIFIHLALTAQ